MKNALLAALVLNLATVGASASVTLTPTVFKAYADDGTTGLPAGSLVAWVAEMSEGAFDAYGTDVLGPETFTFDGVALLGTGVSHASSDGVIQNDFVLDVLDPDAQGKPLGMLWFGVPEADAPTGSGPIGAGPGKMYGFFDTGKDVPNDGISPPSSDFMFLTNEGGGSLPDDTFYATKMTTPEPATVLLMLAGGGLLAARRRRRA